MRTALRFLVSTAVFAALGGGAFAADYNPPIFIEHAPEYVPVEVGSGWYLRGDVAVDIDRRHADWSVLSADPLIRYNQVSYSTERPVALGSVGIGYHFSDLLRGEVNVGILSASKFDAQGTLLNGCDGTILREVTDSVAGTTTSSTLAGSNDCFGTSNGKQSTWTAMANVYADLGTLAGFTPYVGAGLGVAYTQQSTTLGDRTCITSQSMSGAGAIQVTDTFLCDGQTSFGAPAVNYPGSGFKENHFNLAYSLAAGVSYQMTTNASIDLGYEYSSIPNIEYAVLGDAGPEIRKGIDHHRVKIGLRYDLW